MIIRKSEQFSGEYRFPGDKSISHRSALIGAISKSNFTIRNYNPGLDCRSTINCLNSLGADISINGSTVTVIGAGLNGFTKPDAQLDAGNSGTTIRLLSGLLAGQPFDTAIAGDSSLNSRPMGRIINPLVEMGAEIRAAEGGKAPLNITGSKLAGITYRLPVNSAQVKSCVMLAGLLADSQVTVIEPVQTRNHTELMLDIPVERTDEGNIITVQPGTVPEFPDEYSVPGDISGAAFLIAGALISRNGSVTLRNVGINDTRAGILEVLKQMGAEFGFSNVTTVKGEKSADISVSSTSLKGVDLGGSIIPNIIDEIPILAVLGALSSGEFSVHDAAELRVKECDRISATAENLWKMGAQVEEFDDGLRIKGGKKLRGAEIKTYGDHRIAMAFSIAGLAAEGETVIDDPKAAAVSFPDFPKVLEEFTGRINE